MGTVKTRIRTGLQRIRDVMSARRAPTGRGMTHEEARDVMPLYVVDADDRRRRAKLAGPPGRLRGVPRGAAGISGRRPTPLAQSVPQIRPQAGAASRTLAAIVGAEDPQERRARRFTRLPSRCGHSRDPARAGGPRGWPLPRRIVAAVATAGLLADAGGQLAEMRTTLCGVAGARRRGRAAVRRASQATLVTYRRQLDVMTADDLLLVSLSGLPPAGAAQAKAFVSRSQNAIIFTARDLPALPPAQVYQLWASRAARRSAPERSCRMRAAAASSSPTCRR